MAERDDDALSRQDPTIRKGALLLSSLVLSPDNALERYRDQRAGDPQLDLSHLRRARDILDAIGFAVVSTEPQRWKRIEQAWQSLRDDARRPPEPMQEAPADKPTLSTPAAAAVPAAGPAPEARRPAKEPPAVEPADAPPAVGAPIGPPPPAPARPVRPPLVAAPPPIGGRPSGKPSPWAKPKPAEAELDETAPVDLSMLRVDEDPLPFEGEAAPPAPMAPELPPQPIRDLDQTAALGVAVAVGDAVPFGTSSGAAPPELTLEQYASFRAECAVTPERLDEVRTRYGVADEPAQRALERSWEQRLAADADLHQRYEELLPGYERWLRTRTQRS